MDEPFVTWLRAARDPWADLLLMLEKGYVEFTGGDQPSFSSDAFVPGYLTG